MTNEITTHDHGTGARAGHDPGVGERAGQVAGTARDQAQSVAGDVRQEASAVASEAATQARNVLDDTRGALRSQARQGTERTAGALDSLSSQVRALASGDREKAGELGRYADQASERLQAIAERLSSRGFDGLVDDVQSFGRRRPGMFLALAAASGFAAGRLFRGAQAASSKPSASDVRRAAPDRPVAGTYAPITPDGGTTPQPETYGGTTPSPVSGEGPAERERRLER